MAEEAIGAVESGDLDLVPSSSKEQWQRWLGKTEKQDWCVSRQLWWGHRIPAFRVAFNSPEKVCMDYLNFCFKNVTFKMV